MNAKEIGVSQLIDFFRGGCDNLALHKEEVNALNVFPVPDGDTGINMHLTISSAVKKLAEPKENDTVPQIAQNFSLGALMGARGNSGVILSQIFRGFAQSIDSKKALTAVDFAEALKNGSALSYKSVMKPVEGTILSVFRDVADAALEYVAGDDDIAGMLRYAIEAGERSLANTPNLLPVLKQAGVVDAGGKGILVILAGGLAALTGEHAGAPSAAATIEPQAEAAPAAEDLGDIEFGYCSETMVYCPEGENPHEQVKQRLTEEIEGDCLLVIGMDRYVKIHYHTNAPWRVLEVASRFGELRDIKVDNMRVQHRELAVEIPQTAAPSLPLSKCGVLAVCVGDGMDALFRELGATVISGGQTMNPSAEELLQAIDTIAAEEIILLPNNGNIVLTAQQAERLTEKPVSVLESRYVTQGLSAMVAFDKDVSAAENVSQMQDIMDAVVSGEITFAVRDSHYEDRDIRAHDILALLNGEIVINGEDLRQVFLDLVQMMVDAAPDAALISIFYGEDVAEADAEAMRDAVAAQYTDFDVECHYGGQPLYYYLISVE